MIEATSLIFKLSFPILPCLQIFYLFSLQFLQLFVYKIWVWSTRLHLRFRGIFKKLFSFFFSNFFFSILTLVCCDCAFCFLAAFAWFCLFVVKVTTHIGLSLIGRPQCRRRRSSVSSSIRVVITPIAVVAVEGGVAGGGAGGVAEEVAGITWHHHRRPMNTTVSLTMWHVAAHLLLPLPKYCNKTNVRSKFTECVVLASRASGRHVYTQTLKNHLSGYPALFVYYFLKFKFKTYSWQTQPQYNSHDIV